MRNQFCLARCFTTYLLHLPTLAILCDVNVTSPISCDDDVTLLIWGNVDVTLPILCNVDVTLPILCNVDVTSPMWQSNSCKFFLLRLFKRESLLGNFTKISVQKMWDFILCFLLKRSVPGTEIMARCISSSLIDQLLL